jgi:hypothetical protein
LHHLSNKGDWNSSFEKNSDEYYHWKNDGHELCYHALSQSTIWDDQKRIDQFENFESPKELDVSTWIDHGYQPYNLCQSRNNNDRVQKLTHLNSKGINLVWNYYDAGEGVFNLNQNNCESFYLRNIWYSKIKFSDKVRITLFYFGSEQIVLKYRNLSRKIQNSKAKVTTISLYISMLLLLLRCLVSLKLNLIKSTQIFFQTQVNGVTGFQTMVVKDWVRSFGEPLDLLVREKGVAIVHCYFAFLGKHHVNPLFENSTGAISNEVEISFAKLSELIRGGQIWNPTLTEFHAYIQELKNTEIILENGSYNTKYSRNQFRVIL